MRTCHGLTGAGLQGLRVTRPTLPVLVLPAALAALILFLFSLPSLTSQAWGQSTSSVRSFDGGVAPLFKMPGISSLYLDNQGTQGFLYNPGNNFQSFSFRNPTTGQAWSGAVTTFGPQLSIGFIPTSTSPPIPPTRSIRKFCKPWLGMSLPSRGN